MMIKFAIEASRAQSGVNSVIDLNGKSGNRGNRELKKLICLGNYEVKGGQSLRVIGKWRVGNVRYET